MGLLVVASSGNQMFSKMGIEVVHPGKLDFRTANSNEHGMFIVYDLNLNTDELSMIRKYASSNPDAIFIIVTDMADPHMTDRLGKLNPSVWVDMRTNIFDLYGLLNAQFEQTIALEREQQIQVLKSKLESLEQEMNTLSRMMEELSNSNIQLTNDSWMHRKQGQENGVNR